MGVPPGKSNHLLWRPIADRAFNFYVRGKYPTRNLVVYQTRFFRDFGRLMDLEYEFLCGRLEPYADRGILVMGQCLWSWACFTANYLTHEVDRYSKINRGIQAEIRMLVLMVRARCGKGEWSCEEFMSHCLREASEYFKSHPEEA